jgi:hypothetical protein
MLRNGNLYRRVYCCLQSAGDQIGLVGETRNLGELVVRRAKRGTNLQVTARKSQMPITTYHNCSLLLINRPK